MTRHEDALICDFAETYHILDYKRLPVKLAATLASGLRDSSRSKMILHGTKVAPDVLLLAGIVDRLSLLLWTKTKDAVHGRNLPQSIVAEMVGSKQKVSGYASGKEFEEARQAILARTERTDNGN